MSIFTSEEGLGTTRPGGSPIFPMAPPGTVTMSSGEDCAQGTTTVSSWEEALTVCLGAAIDCGCAGYELVERSGGWDCNLSDCSGTPWGPLEPGEPGIPFPGPRPPWTGDPRVPQDCLPVPTAAEADCRIACAADGLDYEGCRAYRQDGECKYEAVCSDPWSESIGGTGSMQRHRGPIHH